MEECIKVEQKETQDRLDESNKRQLEQTKSTDAILVGLMSFIKTSSATVMAPAEKEKEEKEEKKKKEEKEK